MIGALLWLLAGLIASRQRNGAVRVLGWMAIAIGAFSIIVILLEG